MLLCTTHFRLSDPLKLIKLGVDLRWGPQLPLYPPHFRYWPLPPKFIQSPQKPTSLILSLLYMHHFPVLEKGWKNGEWLWLLHQFFFSFSHSHTSHGQCNCYNRSCLRRRLHFPSSTPLEWRNTVALLFTADTSTIQTTVHWRQFLSPGMYLNSWELGSIFPFVFQDAELRFMLIVGKGFSCSQPSLTALMGT